jgi:hypothetical protein
MQSVLREAGEELEIVPVKWVSRNKKPREKPRGRLSN